MTKTRQDFDDDSIYLAYADKQRKTELARIAGFNAARMEFRGGKSKISPLPCLNSNNSIESQLNVESTQHKKSSTALELNVHAFIQKFGIDRVGFLTLTFADNVTDPKEAQRRFNSLRTSVLKPRYGDYIRVFERHQNGSIHYHLLVVCKEDIRRGLNFQAIAKRDYKSACPFLKAEWKFLRENLHKYGFGRAELLPVKSNADGLSKYIAKYIGKHVQNRKPEDKGYRLVQFSQGTWKVATSNFSYLSVGSAEWRFKLSKWVKMVECYLNSRRCLHAPISINESNYSEMLQKYVGKHWAFKNRNTIINSII